MGEKEGGRGVAAHLLAEGWPKRRDGAPLPLPSLYTFQHTLAMKVSCRRTAAARSKALGGWDEGAEET